MSVGPAGSAAALVSLLKAELAEGSRRRTSSKTGPETNTGTGETAQTAASLRTQLVQVARRVDLTDPVAVKPPAAASSGPCWCPSLGPTFGSTASGRSYRDPGWTASMVASTLMLRTLRSSQAMLHM